MRDRLSRAQRHGAATAALLGFALIAGCGGGSDVAEELGVTTLDTGTTAASTPTVATEPAAPTAGAARSDESLIRGAITAVFSSGDPAAACEKYATGDYVTTAFGDLDGCRAAISSGGSAKGVTMTRIAVDGDMATAVAVPIGGPSGDEAIDLTLFREGPVWKVDSAKSNVPVGP